MSDEDIIIGVDLGTTNCRIGIWRNKQIEIVYDKHGNRNIPSIIAFNKNGRLSGYDAKLQIEKNPLNTFYDVKRLIGKTYDDPTVQNDKNYFTYKIDKTADNNIMLLSKYGKGEYSPEEITAVILTKVKNIAQKYVSEHISPNIQINKAIITIPAYFNESQRQATKDAATIAGLECVRMLNEPTAAALAYGLNNRDNCNDINIIVYDLGGGTLDVSLLNMDGGLFKVLATTGNTHLGGEDFDEVLYKYSISKFFDNNKSYFDDMNVEIKPKYYRKSLQKLRNSCEKAKINLSNDTITNINVSPFYVDTENNISLDLSVVITREKFEELASELFEEAMKPIIDILNYTKMKPDQIDEIILVGGTTRIPKIQFMIHNYFNKQPCLSINPDFVVATGAGIQGYMLSHKDDPFCNDLVLVDVVPLTLGIETMDGIMTPIIEKNSPIPVNKSKRFTTTDDNTETVEIKIFEGERKLTKDNFHIGTFLLKDIQKAPKGVPSIIVTFTVDINGIINVEAVDKKMRSESKITITGNNRRLTPEQIQKLVKEANEYEKEDTLKQNLIELFYDFKRVVDMVEYNVAKNEESKIVDTDKNIIIDDLKKLNEYFISLLVPNEYYKFDIITDNSVSIGNVPYKLNIMDNESNESLIEKQNFLQILVNKYKNKLRSVKKKYATFILQMNNLDESKIKSANSNTDIYEDINEDDNNEQVEDMNKLFESKIEDININKDDENKIVEKKRVIELCDSITKFVTEDTKLLQHNKIKIMEYINNVKIWMNVNVTISPKGYNDKYDEIDTITGSIIISNNEELEAMKMDYKQELINLCNLLIKSINDKKIPLEANKLSILINKLLTVSQWVNESSLKTDDIMYLNKINEINKLCDELVK